MHCRHARRCWRTHGSRCCRRIRTWCRRTWPAMPRSGPRTRCTSSRSRSRRRSTGTARCRGAFPSGTFRSKRCLARRRRHCTWSFQTDTSLRTKSRRRLRFHPAELGTRCTHCRSYSGRRLGRTFRRTNALRAGNQASWAHPRRRRHRSQRRRSRPSRLWQSHRFRLQHQRHPTCHRIQARPLCRSFHRSQRTQAHRRCSHRRVPTPGRKFPGLLLGSSRSGNRWDSWTAQHTGSWTCPGCESRPGRSGQAIEPPRKSHFDNPVA